MKTNLPIYLLIALTLAASPSPAAQRDDAAQRSYSPALTQVQPRQVFWGDTHLHTNLSPDAAAGGNRQFGADTAYRLARGEAVTAHNGMQVQLNRPLDFLLVADHAEYMGLFPGLDNNDPRLLQTKVGRRWHQMLRAGPEEAAKILIEFGNALRNNEDLLNSQAFKQSVWQTVVSTAQTYNDPGKFTAFIGYEWSSSIGGGNMHRIVLFADGADKTQQITPFSSFDSNKPRALWRFMAKYQQDTGGQVLAIPHNSNVSAGLMFALTDTDGQAISKDYATQRARWEPLLEVTQFKGDSETHPFVSPNDAFADYESWDRFASFSQRPHEDWMFEGEYARPALRRGLALMTQIDVNPFRFGLIGSTDSHTGIPSADENNFWGKFSWHEPSATRASERFVNIPDITQYEWEMAASGMAAVWAEENTRAALFAAMQRRETYATTGPRMRVRLFGGWDFRTQDLQAPDWVQRGYSKGVPMGGELTSTAKTAVPSFLVSAWKDPQGANLDRVQMVKGWVTEAGETAEQVYDIALSGARQPDPSTGAVPAVGNTVDAGSASYSNSIGAAQLQVVWSDPAFDPTRAAFYYVRVLEIPTPRWTAFDAHFFATELPANVPMTTQERAYTSPIWYTPP